MAPRGGLHRVPATAWREGRNRLPCQHPSVRTRSLLLVHRPVVLAAALLLTAGCADRSGSDAAAATGRASTSSAAASGTSEVAPTATQETVEEAGTTSPRFPADTSVDATFEGTAVA
jgi:hypothetical protein